MPGQNLNVYVTGKILSAFGNRGDEDGAGGYDGGVMPRVQVHDYALRVSALWGCSRKSTYSLAGSPALGRSWELRWQENQFNLPVQCSLNVDERMCDRMAGIKYRVGGDECAKADMWKECEIGMAMGDGSINFGREMNG